MVVVEGDEVVRSFCAVQVRAKAPPPVRSCRMFWIWPVAFVFQPLVNLRKHLEPQQRAVDTPAPYYLRMELLDRPGSLAAVAAALGQREVSIHRMRQYDHEGDNAPVLIVTHATSQSALTTALSDLNPMMPLLAPRRIAY